MHGTEEILLVTEVVVQRAARQPGALDDLFRPGALETVLGKKRSGRVEEGAPGVTHVGGPPAGLLRRGVGVPTLGFLAGAGRLRHGCHRRRPGTSGGPVDT